MRLFDFAHHTITIEDSKNGEGRIVKMTQKVFELLKACCQGKGDNDFVFTRDQGKRKGKLVKNFRKAWKEATKAAGVPDQLVHDLRRTGACNLRHAGIDRDLIMKVGGWKTGYNIVDEVDLVEAAAALDRKREADRSQLSHNSLVAETARDQQEIKIQCVSASPNRRARWSCLDSKSNTDRIDVGKAARLSTMKVIHFAYVGSPQRARMIC